MPAPPLLESQRAELSTTQTAAPPFPRYLHLWPDGRCGRAYNSSRDLCLDPVPSVHVGMCVPVCVPPPAHMHPAPSGPRHLPLSSLVHGNPDSEPCYSCYKRTQVCHFTKNRRVLWIGHLPRTSDSRPELQSPVSVFLSGNTPVT